MKGQAKSMLSVRVCEIDFHRLDMQTRFPFQYGIASMTDVPHLFVAVTLEVGGRVVRGVSADVLPPKWFTKNPDTSFEEDDLPAMLNVIRHAADTAVLIGLQADFFTWWHELYRAQHSWANDHEIAQLLAGFGTSLVERAVLDAVCRDAQVTLFQAIRDNTPGINFALVRPSLRLLQPHHVLPRRPKEYVRLRHTIGLGDSLRGEAIAGGEDPVDGLPYTLVESISAYGLQSFKIKLSGHRDADLERLNEILSILEHDVGSAARFTLDGNERFETMAEFRSFWRDLRDSKKVRDFFDRSLMFVEQPVQRSFALHESVGDELRSWVDAPPVIIDESDADLTCLPKALSLGYSGTSHKNCKGIMKGVLAAATIFSERTNAKPLILSAEDLCNVGPVALLQDLAMVAALGISHVERNGHHYFAGLSMFPRDIQENLLAQHSDLYERHPKGFATLAPRDGMLSMKSVNGAPFGLVPLPDVEQFERWEF